MKAGTQKAALWQALGEVHRAISLKRAGASRAEVLKALLESACVCAGAVSAALFLGEGTRLKLAAAAHTSAQFDAELSSICAAEVSNPCAVAAAQTDTRVDANLTAAEGNYSAFAKRYAVSACWSFPLSGGERSAHGVMSIFFAQPKRPSSSQLQFLEFVAALASLVVERYAARDLRASEEAQLRQSEARYRSLTSILTSVVWTTDPDGRFVKPQLPWEVYTGQAWEQQQGYGWLNAIHPEDRDAVLEATIRAKAAKGFYRADGRLWSDSEKRYRFVEARGMPVFDEHGEILEWIGTCLDVTVRKEAEDALITADRRKDEFMAVLAHELRNPLTPIRNAVQILRKRGSGDVQLSWATGVIERQVAHVSRLLEDLLDIGRIARNALELRKTRVTLDSIIESALETSRPFIEQRGHTLELVALEAPVYVEADETRLAQVFSNLLINAAKYTNRGGSITLTIRTEGQEAVVCVKDNGIGIDPAMVSKLFRMYSQTSNDADKSAGGLGIGLALVRGVLEMHGGRVEAHSEGLGCGSEFVVHLPLASQRVYPCERATALRPREPLRVLVADDHQDSVETLSVFLQMLGYEVRTAIDGEQAVQIARSFAPDAAVLDLGMPTLDGAAAAAQIRRLLPTALIVATSGWEATDTQSVTRLKSQGIDCQLTKPVDLNQLAQLLESWTAVKAPDGA